MPFRQIGPLRAFQFESFESVNIEHAIFTRQGGVSPEPWASLNLGGTVGDERDRVLVNKQRALDAFGRAADSLYEVWQVHSADVVLAREPRRNAELIKADALITDSPDVTLLMRFADCVPILIADPVRGAIGLIHAGWLGTVRQTATSAVRAMSAAFGSRPQDLVAGIGPSIGPDHYPVGEEVVGQVRAVFGDSADAFLQPTNGHVHFDLWAANRRLLLHAGVGAIETADVCTACHLDDWYSHRGESGRTGRFAAMLALHG
jgi:polyphenol oxidase